MEPARIQQSAAPVAAPSAGPKKKTQIVVVGGGAGGLELVTRLGAHFGNRDYDIILVERNRTHVWKPLLHEVAAGALDANLDEVGYRAHCRRWRYRFFYGSLLDRVPVANSAWTGENPDPGTSKAPYRLYNIGNNEPVELMRYIEVLEDCLGRKAEKKLLPLQPGDVPDTYADVDDLVRDVDYRPNTSIEVGVAKFVDWYRAYYRT